MPRLDFYQRAEKLGHSAERLRDGRTVLSHVTVNSVDELRELLDDGASDEQRAERTPDVSAAPEGEDGFAGVLRRVHAHVYGNHELSEDDRKAIRSAFPLTVMAVSAENLTIDGKLDLGTSAGVVVRNYGTVTMSDQAYVTLQNTALQWTMDTLVRNGSPPSGRGDFNVLGATGGAGGAGATGGTGAPGSPGQKGECSSAGIAGHGGTNGATGGTGSSGNPGDPGGNGLPSLVATITVTAGITGTSSLQILTRSGTGGQGGTGGRGGTGGAGGKGGDGVTCGCTGNGAGSGGAGGNGGVGGTGGTGGAGVDAAGNVTVVVPAAQTNMVIKLPYPAPAGQGGTGGAGGPGGPGGAKGSGGKHNGDGNTGSRGSTGSVGSRGGQGARDGNAAQIVVQPY